MKTFSSKILPGGVALCLTAAIALAAEGWTPYSAQFRGSNVRIEGTSTIHDWHADGALIGGSMEVPADFPTDANAKLPDKLSATPKVQANIPVTSLKCSSGKPMDDVMYDAMNQKTFPRIEYRLTEMTPKPDAKVASGFVFDTKGDLVVAGVTNTVSMPVTVTYPEPDKIRITGSTSVKMTDFGIKPPAPKIALGMIKTGDDVKIQFEWVAAKKAAK